MPRAAEPSAPFRAAVSDDDGSAALLDAARRTLAPPAPLLEALRSAPATLDAFLALSWAVSEGPLAPAVRGRIALAVAGIYQEPVCIEAARARAHALGIGEVEVALAMKGRARDARLAALLAFVTEVIRRPGRIRPEIRARLAGAGWGRAEILDALGVACRECLANLVCLAAREGSDAHRAEPSAEARALARRLRTA